MITPDPYLIHLHGGPLDGYRQSLSYFPLAAILEIPGSLPCPAGSSPSPRTTLYELRRASIEIVGGLPTMVLDHYFVGTRANLASAAIQRVVRWKDRLTRTVLRAARGPRGSDASHVP